MAKYWSDFCIASLHCQLPYSVLRAKVITAKKTNISMRPTPLLLISLQSIERSYTMSHVEQARRNLLASARECKDRVPASKVKEQF